MRDILIILTLAILVIILVLPMNMLTGHAVAGSESIASIVSMNIVRPTIHELPVPVGDDVSIIFPLDKFCVEVTFESVTAEGVVIADIDKGNKMAGERPPSSAFRALGVFIDLSTTATYEGTVEVCLNCFDIKKGYKIFHHEDGKWKDVTTKCNAKNDILCGEVTTLSPFGAFSGGGSASAAATGGGGGSSRKLYTPEAEPVVEEPEIKIPEFKTVEIKQETPEPIVKDIEPIKVKTIPKINTELPTMIETNEFEQLNKFLYLLLGLSITGIIGLILLNFAPKKKKHKKK